MRIIKWNKNEMKIECRDENEVQKKMHERMKERKKETLGVEHVAHALPRGASPGPRQLVFATPRVFVHP